MCLPICTNPQHKVIYTDPCTYPLRMPKGASLFFVFLTLVSRPGAAPSKLQMRVVVSLGPAAASASASAS